MLEHVERTPHDQNPDDTAPATEVWYWQGKEPMRQPQNEEHDLTMEEADQGFYPDEYYPLEAERVN